MQKADERRVDAFEMCVLQEGPKNTMDRKENQRMGLKQDWK